MWHVAEFNKWILSYQLTLYQRADEWPSSRHNETTLAANHDRHTKQMAVISECANVRECSRGSQPITSRPHSLDQKTDDIRVRHLNGDERGEVRFE